MEPRFFDTHSHPHFPQFVEDLPDMLARMEELSVWTVAIGTGIEQSRAAIAFAEAHKNVWATIGIHPNDGIEEFDDAVFGDMAKNPKVVAVGECGLDYFRSEGDSEHERQKKLFSRHMAFAHKHNLPLVLHIRPTKTDMQAHYDALDILRSFSDHNGAGSARGICHFYTGPADIALEYVQRGFSIAFPGVITFAPETHDAVRAVPLTNMVAETDSPYAAPKPHRGRRNEPSFVTEVYKAIASIRGEDEDEVRVQLTKNARAIYSI